MVPAREQEGEKEEEEEGEKTKKGEEAEEVVVVVEAAPVARAVPEDPAVRGDQEDLCRKKCKKTAAAVVVVVAAVCPAASLAAPLQEPAASLFPSSPRAVPLSLATLPVHSSLAPPPFQPQKGPVGNNVSVT